MMTVECVYAPVDAEPVLVSLQVAENSTAMDVVSASGFIEQFPILRQQKYRLSIFSRFIELGKIVREGDRVEITVALKYDPKIARRQRSSQ